MATGIAFPAKVNPRGGAVTKEGKDLVRQNIILALLPANTMNPWDQNIALKENLIFDIKDDITGGLVFAHIHRVFDEMKRQNIAMLPMDGRGIRIEDNGKEGELEIVIEYIDIEDNQSREIRFDSGGRL